MKQVLTALFIVFIIIACKDKPVPKTLCTNPCLDESLKFTSQHPAGPYMYVVANNCFADTILWSHKYLTNNRAIHLSTFMESIINLDKSTVKGYVIDTSFAMLVFNDCNTRRGYWLKLPFDKSKAIEKSVSAINNIDPRYKIDDDLLCYKSKNTVYVDNIRNGKQTIIEIEKPELSYAEMYNIIDSVNITKSRFFMQLKDGSEKIPVERTIDLQ